MTTDDKTSGRAGNDKSSSSTILTCIPGQSIECTCVSGKVGVQTCLEDKTFGSCRCDNYVSDIGYSDTSRNMSDAYPLNGSDIESHNEDTVRKEYKISDISSGSHYTCALMSNGHILCWGYGLDGVLGAGNNAKLGSRPIKVKEISSAIDVDAGHSHTCAVLRGGDVQCWGVNSDGQLGHGSKSSDPRSTPVEVKGISSATSVSAGGAHTCALLRSGEIRCWGDGLSGQLGNGSISKSSIPVKVQEISSATAISAGVAYTCAILMNGEVQCWGEIVSGQTGNISGNQLSPEIVPNITSATSISTGTEHTCVVSRSG
jgi:alpha-tubulin suppressor-like RCC1 family protein